MIKRWGFAPAFADVNPSYKPYIKMMPPANSTAQMATAAIIEPTTPSHSL